MKEIESIHDMLDLQKDVSEMDVWSKTWLIRFNLEICQFNFRKTKTHHSSLYSWKPSSRTNTNGVLIDSNLSFESHMAAKITKENQIVGLIRRSFSFLDGNLFRRLFIAFVRPHHWVCTPSLVATPQETHQQRGLQQHRESATKIIDGFKNLEYQERLVRLNLPTLASLRLKEEIWLKCSNTSIATTSRPSTVGLRYVSVPAGSTILSSCIVERTPEGCPNSQVVKLEWHNSLLYSALCRGIAMPVNFVYNGISTLEIWNHEKIK